MKIVKATVAVSVLIVVFFISFFGASTNASDYVLYIMEGKIAAIDLRYNTVVIEIPMGSRMFTIGGPLLPEARLKKGGVSVDLKAFKVGESVTVRWRHTGKGHVIEGLFVK